jgi:hypothetical protein
VQHHAICIVLQLHAPGTAGQRAAGTDGAVIASKIGGTPQVERFPDELIGRSPICGLCFVIMLSLENVLPGRASSPAMCSVCTAQRRHSRRDAIPVAGLDSGAFLRSLRGNEL